MLYLPDANVLLYGFLKSSPHHLPARSWLERVLTDGSQVLLAQLVEVALLRIPTLPALGDLRVPIDRLLDYWTRLRAQPNVRRVAPGARHGALLEELITGLTLGGNDVNDAWLAALALEQGATLVSADRGFSRFARLLWHDPFASGG